MTRAAVERVEAGGEAALKAGVSAPGLEMVRTSADPVEKTVKKNMNLCYYSN